MRCRVAKAVNAKLHISNIRSLKFSIGQQKPNPLNQDLHRAVNGLSAELYTKDVHFIMELIQNAEDNEYPAGAEPTLEFWLTKNDITGLGAPATLLVFNNEVGFSRQNMDSICSVGRSTKKGRRGLGFIGEKGIGFKSVFLVSSWPHIFSNGYRVRFSEEPDKECGIGYIVPEWAGNLRVSDICATYGKVDLPTTIIILPLKPDKVEAVEAQLSELHPEILLFLSKIKKLHVRDYNYNPNEPHNISTLSISSETDHMQLRAKKADSRIVHLSVKKTLIMEDTCKYYLWRQAFPVRLENKVDARKDVGEWVVMLAFPCGERLRRGTSSVGVFAFLPTAMVTNFPFVIQADFMLSSSRETITLNNKWNLGIFECIPQAFVNAFMSSVKENSKLFPLQQAFTFLPVKVSPVPEFNTIRESIRAALQRSEFVPCSHLHGEGVFRLPCGVTRILPEFRKILHQFSRNGAPLDGLSTLKKYSLVSSLDHTDYRATFDFLGVASADDDYGWYEKCISACNIAFMASDVVYIQLLCFVADNKTDVFSNLDFLKYTDVEGNVKLCTPAEAKRQQFKVRYAVLPAVHHWLSKCNRELGCPDNMFFLPVSTQRALVCHHRSSFICNWLLNGAGVKACTALDFVNCLSNWIAIKKDPKVALYLAHFLYHSHRKNFISDLNIRICQRIPVIDGSNHLRMRRAATLVSASGSKWERLFGPANPFIHFDYIDMGSVYGESGHFAGEYTHEKELLNFLSKHSGAVDLEGLQIPNAALEVASSRLTCEQAFLLLDWIRSKRINSSHLPEKFVQSVSRGKWLKTYSGFSSPRQSVLPDATGTVIFDMMKNFMEQYTIVDQEFYMNKIVLYVDELKFLGVTFGFDDLLKLVSKCIKCCSSSGMSKDRALSLLVFLGYLKASNMLDEEWLKVIQEGKWLKTHRGFNAPRASILLQADMEAEAVLSITNIPIIDEDFYGSKIASFSSELALLGVVSDMGEVYKLIAENIYFPLNLVSVNSGGTFLLLKCIRHLGSASSGLVEKIQNQRWLRTYSGAKSPVESVLADAEWKCLLNGIGISVIDEAFYGAEIRSFMAELKEIGVSVEVDRTIRVLVAQLKSSVSSSSLTPANIFSLLDCIRWMNLNLPTQISEFCDCLSRIELLKTRHGYKTPIESILFNLKWGTISLFVDLPLVDDSFYGINIYGFKDELKLMGVVTDFVEGAVFVARGLYCPIETNLITAESTISLLECLKSVMTTSRDQPFLVDFIDKLRRSKWLMTNNGYKLPVECFLFDESWDCILHRIVASAIDQRFYDTDISLYKDQLRVIGVKVDPADVCSLLFGLLYSLMETEKITRVYSFLRKFSWKPDSVNTRDSHVWVPNNNEGGGKWVNSQLCVLRDESDLFGSQIYSLANYYDKELLPLLSSAFGVAESPSVDDYLMLWHSWIARANHQVTLVECCSFWGYIVEHWNSNNEESLRRSLTHVPAITSSGNEIFLVKKEEVFVPDDLQITKLFSSVHRHIPLIVWLPTGSTSSFSRRLHNVYSALGVRKISQSIKCQVNCASLDQCSKQDNPKSGLIAKGLIKIILCFLSGHYMSVDKRQKAARCVLDCFVYESENPIQFSYRLTQSDNMMLEVKKTRMVYWQKGNQRLFINRSGYEDRRNDIEFVSCFAEEIADGLLAQERPDLVDSLSNVIKMASLFEFKEDVVDFLLTKANFELSKEDEEFLGKEFFPSQQSAVSIRPHTRSNSQLSGPSTPAASCKKQRR